MIYSHVDRIVYYFVYSYIYYLMIPYIFLQAGVSFCSEDGSWPKTPDGATVINRTCEVGRVGYKSRTCQGTTWMSVSSYCVSEQLNKVVGAADVSVALQLMTTDFTVKDYTFTRQYYNIV